MTNLILAGRQPRYLTPPVSHHVIERFMRAERLHLSVKTIETHRAQLMQRLEIFDVAGLTRYALRIGLIDPER